MSAVRDVAMVSHEGGREAGPVDLSEGLTGRTRDGWWHR
ncbi:hypothetical protein GA0070623_5909 [Micromonospora rifamycinica]|uniref:Uncharacterized protein n=1 Tax=Micromonospora rifamycinica TaxID=291594 RepID=A0A1C5KGI1_9ACTN|nr:hypothetical protein GA0070623_5909 [Micromonospora rifamycinica]